jgi:DNA mismatch repair protein MutL
MENIQFPDVSAFGAPPDPSALPEFTLRRPSPLVPRFDFSDAPVAKTSVPDTHGPLFEGAQIPEPESLDALRDLRPLGQIHDSFIVAAGRDGLWIIDQHVAHERVLFEQHLRSRREGALTGQRLLVPIVVDLTPRQRAILEQISEELSANGFDVTPMGPQSVAIQATPAGVPNSDAERLVAEILDGIEREHQAISIDSLQSQIAASTACHAAIKVNMPLDQTKMEWLLGELAKTESPMSCPHGRPVILRYSLREIERAFKRI